MGLILRAFAKCASVEAPAPPQVQAWHPEWSPEAGWKAPENPTGWRKPLKESQQKELFLWDQWRKGGQTPELSAPLLQSLRPIIFKHGVKPWASRVPIQRPVLEAKATQLVLGALENFNPAQGQVNTHVTNTLKGMHRFTFQRQNVARLAEGRKKLIGPYQRAVQRLREKLERDPTVLELADEMKVQPKQVEQLLNEMKDDYISSASENPFVDETPEAQIRLQLIRYSLTPSEEIVFDYLTGQGGKPLLTSTGAIARREGWADSKVAQLKNAIMRKWKAPAS